MMSEVERRICHVCASLPREYFCGICDGGRDYNALAAQRDEGLAREAELRSEFASLRKCLERQHREALESLQQGLAEVERLPRAVTDVIEIARKIDKEAFAKGTQNVEVGTFRSLAYALARLSCPGCADGEKAE